LREVSGRYQRIIETIRTTSPQTKVYVQAVMPCREQPGRIAVRQVIDARNDDIKRCAHNAGAVFVDTNSPFKDAGGGIKSNYFISDGLHLSSEGYAKWIEILTPYLRSP